MVVDLSQADPRKVFKAHSWQFLMKGPHRARNNLTHPQCAFEMRRVQIKQLSRLLTSIAGIL
jgi:hypothetical protein